MSSEAVTPDQIVEEAIAIMKEEGLDAVTLRRVAGRLGIKAPSLYWHIENKGVLFLRMSRVLFDAAIAHLPEGERWQDWMLEYGISLWRLQRDIPDTRKLLLTMPVDDEMRRRGRERMAGILAGMGMPFDDAGIAHEAVMALVTGWSHLRDSWGSQPEEEQFVRSLQALILGWEQTIAVAQGRG